LITNHSDLPNHIGKYKIIREVGRGGMGIVYEAIDPYIKRKVAIKRIRLDSIRETVNLEKWKKYFLNEARLTGNLNHQNIVTIYEVGEDSEILYIAMEFVEGKSLKQLITSQGKLFLGQIYSIMGQICNAMSYAHQRGVIHCDIKPGNILVTNNEKVVIVDFGIARTSEFDITENLTLVGTPSYMSPEQLKKGKVDYRSDIFSIGVVLYEMITGQKPFSGENIAIVIKKILTEDPPNITSIMPDFSSEFNQILKRCLAKNPDERYQSCKKLYNDIIACQVSLTDIHNADNDTLYRNIHSENTDKAATIKKKKPVLSLTQFLGKGILKKAVILFVVLLTGVITIYLFKRFNVSKNELPRSKLPGYQQPTAKIESQQAAGNLPEEIKIYQSIAQNKNDFSNRKSISVPVTHDDYVLLAKRLLKAGDYNRAVDVLCKRLGLQKNSHQIHYLMGIVYKKHGQLDNSFSEFKKAISLNRTFPLPYKELADICETKGKIRQAISFYLQYCMLESNKKKMAKCKNKLEELQTKLQIKEKKADSSEKLASYLRREKYDSATKKFQTALSVNQHNKEPNKYLKFATKQKKSKTKTKIDKYYSEGIRSLRGKNFSSAIFFFKKVLEIDPNHNDAKEKLHLAKQNLRDLNSAIKQHCEKGRQFMNKGDYLKAINCFSKVLRLDPNNREAKEYLKRAKIAFKNQERIGYKKQGDARLPQGW